MQDYFQSYWQAWLPQFDQLLANTLRSSLANQYSNKAVDQLIEAMLYSSLAGGKRMRGLLVFLVADCCNGVSPSTQKLQSPDKYAPLVQKAALAAEIIHCYSLIHDDLPSMDNDDLRRGKATCHIVYGDAIAILAGDALQSLAFDLLSSTDLEQPTQRAAQQTAPQAIQQLALINCLANAAGALGMVGGQAVDLRAENSSPNLDQLTQLHRLKTGKLIEAATSMGAICASASAESSQALSQYAHNIGLAFQVRDDIIDITSSSEQLGKTQGADQEANKSTFPALLGLDGAKEQAEDLFKNALLALSSFGEEANALRGMAEFFIQRPH